LCIPTLLRSLEFDRNPSKENALTIEHSEQLLIQSRSVVSRVVASETLVVPVRGKVGDLASIYSFNGTGSLIWQLLDEPRGLSDLVGAVEREFLAEPEQARKDVMKFVDDLFSEGLVELCPSTLCRPTSRTATINSSTGI
jgi:hypothetical protein